MTVWLDTARALVLGQPLPDTAAALLADAGDPTPEPDLDAARASFAVWERALEQHVFPVLDEAFGEAFAANQRAADISVVHWQELAMATVHDRLKIWPEGAFEELRPELLEAMANNEDIDQVQDRIGRILGIDAPARRIRAEISAVDRKLKDPTTPRAEIPILKGKRRQLWNQHDERNLEWQWLARRIARTEIQAAMEAGALVSAQASEEITGEKMYKRWLSTHDERTRLSHSVADGQMVRLTEPFIVGGTPIQHPADPAGVAHETINCRCTLAILSWDEMQVELQGMWGGRGVGPMNARLGPDDEAAVATAIDRLKRERNGEVVDDELAPTTTVTEDAAEELGKRRKVRTPEGEKKYRKPIDSWIDGGPDEPNLPDLDSKVRAPGSDAPGAPTTKANRPAQPAETPATKPETKAPDPDRAPNVGTTTPELRPLPAEAPEGSDLFAQGFSNIETVRLPAHKEELYPGVEHATPELVDKYDLVSPKDAPLEKALHPPKGDPDENAARAAAGLIACGIDARTVAEIQVIEGYDQNWKTGDLLLLPDTGLAEVKRAATDKPDNVVVRVREGRKQSRNVIADASGGGLTIDGAREALQRAVTNPRIGPHLDNLWIVTAAGTVYWSRAQEQ
ncbi:phage minor head protein [Rhodococcus sp. AG1013]|uniref:phage minor head protein n=1 Tax=Rhodococcus sp. AG1013 TaxID=2183996 RepID=UPI0015F0C399|nr:phage minor head protein [Rhodococcus sp. AG1013]